jgi:hypothetical protein
MEVKNLPYITRQPLTDSDRQNIRLAKQEVTDQLVRLVPWTTQEHALAFGYSAEDNDLPQGATFHCIPLAHRATLAEAIRRVLQPDEDWDDTVWAVQMMGGK